MNAVAGARQPVVPWDYAALAAHYELRAPYHPAFGAAALRDAGLAPPLRVADIGSGTGRVALALAALGCQVDAVEPCAEMRAIGIARSEGFAIAWHESRGEATGLPAQAFGLLSYGSSLNVLQPIAALQEAERLLAPGGALLVVYNHRDLDDPLQRALQEAITRHLPDFSHGSRREDPTPVLERGDRFSVICESALGFEHHVQADEFVAGFRAHATLQRQAGARFDTVLEAIAAIVAAHAGADGRVAVPFTTRYWIARRR